MRRFLAYLLPAVTLVAGSAMAESKFIFRQPLLNYQTADTSVTVGEADAVTAKTTATSTQPIGVQLEIVSGKGHIYLMPLGASHAPIKPATLGYGYDVIPNLEVGAILGHWSTSDDSTTPSSTTSESTYGLNVMYLVPMGSMHTQFGLGYNMGSAATEVTTTTDGTATTVKTSTTSNNLWLSAKFGAALCDNIGYYALLTYSMANATEDESDTSTDMTTMDLTVAGFEFMF